MTVNQAIEIADRYTAICDIEEYTEVTPGEHEAVDLLVAVARVAIAHGIVEGDKEYDN